MAHSILFFLYSRPTDFSCVNIGRFECTIREYAPQSLTSGLSQDILQTLLDVEDLVLERSFNSSGKRLMAICHHF